MAKYSLTEGGKERAQLEYTVAERISLFMSDLYSILNILLNNPSLPIKEITEKMNQKKDKFSKFRDKINEEDVGRIINYSMCVKYVKKD